MEDKRALKQALYQACEAYVRQRIETIQQRLQAVEEAKGQETKSSVGDKYETGRAMMQLEEEKSRKQLAEANQVQLHLSAIRIDKTTETVGQGSLVETNHGYFFIAIGMGKHRIGKQLYYCISARAPIAKAMMNKQSGTVFRFNEKDYRILAVD